MVTFSWLIPLYIRIKRTCHKISPRSQNCIRSISIRRRPLYRSDIKMAQLTFGNVKWSIRHRMVDVEIPSPRELNGMKIDINATSFGQASQCRYRSLSILYIHVGFSDLEADICPPSNCRRRFSKLIPSFSISKQQNGIFVSRLQIYISISIWCRMTDVKLAVESYLSISLATYLSDIVWLTSSRQRNHMESISIRHRVLYRPYISIMLSKRYHNGIFTSAPVLKSNFWHRMVDIVFSTELDRIHTIWYRPICRSNIALPLLKRYRNGVFHWYLPM